MVSYQIGVKPCISARPVAIGKVKMPPVQIPAATKLVIMKQYRIPGGHEEISQTSRDLLDVGVLKPTITAWDNPIWPVKKSDGS